MDLNKIKNEDFDKKSNFELLKINEELHRLHEDNKTEIIKILDKQDLIESVHIAILEVLKNRIN